MEFLIYDRVITLAKLWHAVDAQNSFKVVAMRTGEGNATDVCDETMDQCRIVIDGENGKLSIIAPD